MKILITTDWYNPVINGVVTSVLSLTKGLETLGNEVRILTLSGTHNSYIEGNVTYIGSIGVGKIYPNARFKTSLASTYIRELVIWKPDVIHSQCEFSTFFIAKRISKLCQAPLIHTYHTVYENYTHYFLPSIRFGKYIAAAFSRKVLSQTDLVIAPTEKVANLLKGYDVETPIITIPSGLELERFAQKTMSKARCRIRKKLGISSEEIMFIYVGRLAAEKNIEELFHLLKKLPNDNRLLLVGDGPQREFLETLVKRSRLQQRIIFVGMIPPQLVSQYYAAGDVFVSASQSETQGLTYIEAMASGLVLICKSDACLNGVVNSGVNGFIYKSEDEFLQTAEKLLSDENLRKHLSEHAAFDIFSRYSSERFAQSVIKAYMSIFEKNTETGCLGMM